MPPLPEGDDPRKRPAYRRESRGALLGGHLEGCQRAGDHKLPRVPPLRTRLRGERHLPKLFGRHEVVVYGGRKGGTVERDGSGEPLHAGTRVPGAGPRSATVVHGTASTLSWLSRGRKPFHRRRDAGANVLARRSGGSAPGVDSHNTWVLGMKTR